jgi:signal transduction histidine kinase
MTPGDNSIETNAGSSTIARTLGLRNRIVLGFLLFGLLLSSGFAGVAYFAMDDFEEIVVRQLIQSEMQQVIELRRVNADTTLPSSRRMHVYVQPLDSLAELPAGMRALRPGIQVMDEDGEHETYVDVQDADFQRFFYFIDIGAIAERESFVQTLLAAIVVLGTLASGALGSILAGYLIAPVQRLSRWVDESAPEYPSGVLANQFADDEVGALATAFDRYQLRLEAFLRREREFTADASHELRSPLTVLKIGMDLIAEDQGLGPAGQRALMRMQRRAAELNGLLDVLLYLARGDSIDQSAPISLLADWQRRVEERESQPGEKPVRLGGDDDATVTAPRQICAVVFDHLFNQAASHASGQELRIDISANRIAFGPLSLPSESLDARHQRRSDEQLGLTLVARVCERMGWALEFAPHAELLLLIFKTSPA